MKVDSIIFPTIGGSSQMELRLILYEFLKTTQNGLPKGQLPKHFRWKPNGFEPKWPVTK